MLIGAHESVAGGLFRGCERGVVDGCKAIQIFSKNSNTWREPELSAEQIDAFLKAREAAKISSIQTHTSYLINLGTDRDDLLARSKTALINEIERSSKLGIDFVVLHPGAHLGAGDEVGIQRVAEALDEIHDRTPNATTRVLLENTAGQGTCLGHTFEQLGAMFERADSRDRMGICFDTQHVYAAGYDMTTAEGYAKTWEKFDQLVGLARLKAFHLNDSKKPLASRVDRHEHIGEGLLGLPLFWRLINDPRFASTPGVLETEPREGGTPFKVEVDLLNGLLSAPEPKAKEPVFALEPPPPLKAKRSRS